MMFPSCWFLAAACVLRKKRHKPILRPLVRSEVIVKSGIDLAHYFRRPLSFDMNLD